MSMLDSVSLYLNMIRDNQRILKKPQFVFRFLKAFLQVNLLKRHYLTGVDFAINYDCNLSCEHCFITAFDRGKEGLLTTDEIIGIIEELLDAGVILFTFQGGEVLLNRDLERIIKACKPEMSMVQIFTNGLLLSEKRIKELAEWGVDSVCLSIDSLDASDHDAFRGRKGVLNKALESLRLLRKYRIVPHIHTTITHQSLRSKGMNDLVEFCIENKYRLTFLIGQMAGNWRQRYDILITKEDAAYMQSLFEKYPFIKRDIHGTMNVPGCPAIKQTVYITAYGDVLPCPFVHISFGNLKKERLADIRQRGLRLGYFNQYHPQCLAAEDKEFIERYVSKTFESETLPLSHEKAFN